MAIRTITKTIPARAEETHVIEITICDLCGNPEAKSQPLIYDCTVCGRKVCTKCSHYVTTRCGSGDAPLCSCCYPFRDQYVAALDKLDADHDAAFQATMEKWRRESLAKDSS